MVPERVAGRKRNITHFLMGGATQKVSSPFDDVLNMNLTTFFQLIFQHNVDLNNKNCFGAKIDKHSKEKTKQVFGQMQMMLVPEEVSNISRLKVSQPAPDSPYCTSWTQELVALCGCLSEKMHIDIKDMIEVHNKTFGKCYNQRKKVTSVGVASAIINNYWMVLAIIEAASDEATTDKATAENKITEETVLDETKENKETAVLSTQPDEEQEIDFGDGHNDIDESDDDLYD